jgi:predicted DNA-binding transcriptional regulator AlpA
MHKTNGPRRNSRTASFQTKSQPKRTDSDDDVRPETPKMFNILLALESARGLLRVRDVAALLGRSSWSVYRMAETRQIPSLLIGGSRCFDPSVLALWLSKKEPTLAVAARRFKVA